MAEVLSGAAKSKYVLVIDDSPAGSHKRSKRHTCEALTGFDPVKFARRHDLTTYGEIWVIPRRGNGRIAQRLVEELSKMVDGTGPTVSLQPGDLRDIYPKYALDDDMTLASEFCFQYQHVLRCVVDVNRWLAWTGSHWEGLYEDVGTDRARSLLLVFMSSRGKERADDIEAEMPVDADDDEQKMIRLRAQKVEESYRSTRRVEAVWKQVTILGRSNKELAIKASDLNRDAWLLAAPNGTIDLRTGELRAHDPSELCTALTRVYYDPEAECPAFLKFLSEAQPDEEIRLYLQRRTGSAMVGRQREHALHVDLGMRGRNGKTTFNEAIAWVLGSYAHVVDPKILMVSRGERHPVEIAELVGRRFVLIDETRGSRSMDMAAVKRLTGGSTRSGRFMNKNPFTYTPTDTMTMVTNALAKFEGGDEALGVRLKILGWNVSFARREDLDLPLQIRNESEGVLAWCVRGAVEYAKHGLAEPAAVTELTREERLEHDPVGRWLEENIVPSPGTFTVAEAAYVQCKSLFGPGEASPTSRAFSMRFSAFLSEKGWDVEKTRITVGGKEVRGWTGIDIANPGWRDAEVGGEVGGL